MPKSTILAYAEHRNLIPLLRRGKSLVRVTWRCQLGKLEEAKAEL
jgi:hypothetical protein